MKQFKIMKVMQIRDGNLVVDNFQNIINNLINSGRLQVSSTNTSFYKRLSSNLFYKNDYIILNSKNQFIILKNEQYNFLFKNYKEVDESFDNKNSEQYNEVVSKNNTTKDLSVKELLNINNKNRYDKNKPEEKLFNDKETQLTEYGRNVYSKYIFDKDKLNEIKNNIKQLNVINKFYDKDLKILALGSPSRAALARTLKLNPSTVERYVKKTPFNNIREHFDKK